MSLMSLHMSLHMSTCEERGLTRIFEKLIANRLVLPNVWFRPFLKDDAWQRGW